MLIHGGHEVSEGRAEQRIEPLLSALSLKPGSVREGDCQSPCGPLSGSGRLPPYYVGAVGALELGLNCYPSVPCVTIGDFPVEAFADACFTADALVSEEGPLHGVERTALPSVVLAEQDHDGLVKLKLALLDEPAKASDFQSR